MLRLKILASVVPLLLAGIFARSEFSSDTRPCIAIGETSVQLASTPWQAQLRVSFTDDRAAATVRVQITDSAEAADFVVVDDAESAEANACEVTAATKFVGIANAPCPALICTRGIDEPVANHPGSGTQRAAPTRRLYAASATPKSG